MDLIRHRVNDLAVLNQLDPSLGVEIDIRSNQNRLLLAHDPHTAGPALADFLALYARRGFSGPLVLNTKEDGHEAQLLLLMKRHKIDNFFFLDSAMPTLIRLALRQGEPRVALRVSEFEPAAAALAFAGKARWIWLDCFEGKPFSGTSLRKLRRHFKICLVSPELQGHPRESIAAFKSLAPDLDAVCTKFPDAWR